MQHILDNPVWHALISGNKHLAIGTDTAKVFSKEVSPIVGLQDYTTAHFQALYEIIATDSPIVIFSKNKVAIPDMWEEMFCISGYQMVYAGGTLPPLQQVEEVTPLTEIHIPQMLALTQLTNPGPFNSRTIEFGYYEGIFKNGALVAMAGQRLHPYQYAEISAVCTHPDYIGKGYAKQLLLSQMHRMIAAGDVPFLHVRDDNARAIDVYKALKFEIRTPVLFYVIKKKIENS